MAEIDDLRAQVERLNAELTQQGLRLSIAERVCLMAGWTPPATDSDRGKALHMLWRAWADYVGDDFTGPAAHPEMTDEWIASLARERDEIRARAMARLHGEGT